MRMVLAMAGLLMASAGTTQAQIAPAERENLERQAERYLMPCKAPDEQTCRRARSLLLLVYPDAVFGRPRQMRRVSELLAEGPEPPMKRDLVEACAWATLAAGVAAKDSPDGVTPPQAERDLVSRNCTRHGSRHMNAGRARVDSLLAEITQMMEGILAERRRGAAK